MMKTSKISVFAVLLAVMPLLFMGCTNMRPISNQAHMAVPDQQRAMREFRAAWIATVANINWPSKPGLSTEEQKKEALVLLDFLQEHHFNAAIFQVRPQADALYHSELEPWSYYLSGEQGTAPRPYYDPLEFWVEEAHKRGLELHIWLNPYRAHHTTGGEVSKHSIVKKMPESVVFLEEGYWWFDPSLQSTQDHSAAVVRDLVQRYDIDGVHFDDYFYPYESYNNGKDFPDDKSWAAYLKDGGQLSRGDWRRQSVNTFIERVYREIKAEKPHVKFGLSPFGVWRPGYPESIQGLDQYNSLYADAKLWLNEGWVDYFTPQLYWPIAQIPQSFPVLLGWWEEQNTYGRHLWPGMNVGRGGDDANLAEVVNQIMITRGMVPKSKGAVHWSISGVTRHQKLSEGLLKGPYNKQALIPSSPWLSDLTPTAPVVSEKRARSEVELSWRHPRTNHIANWVVYSQYGDTWHYEILPKHQLSVTIPIEHSNTKEKLTALYVTAVDRFGNESQ